ncbi:MAG: glycosyltransferase [bacterium]|nr:glycosyltransferase [bacterium]
MKPLITIMIPAYNEEKVLPLLFQRLANLAKKTADYDFEFLFINDGSRDKTFEIIKQASTRDQRISYVNLSRNFGKERAMLAGFDTASGDAVVIIDADLQDPPELIPRMIKFWEQGYDDVYAKRESREGETWLKKATSKWFYSILEKISDVEIQRDTGDFRLLDRRAIEELKKLRENNRYTKGMFSWVGFNKKEITYARDPRAAGETKWNYFKLTNLAIEGITSFTTSPLRISFFAGLIISTFAFFWIAYLLIRPLFGVPTGDGYSSLMSVILFLGGVQLLSLGIIGEYIGRIFTETKNRPVYIAQEIKKYQRNKNEKSRKSI